MAGAAPAPALPACLEVRVVPRDERALGAQQLALRDGLHPQVAQHAQGGGHRVLNLAGGGGDVDVPPACETGRAATMRVNFWAVIRQQGCPQILSCCLNRGS